MAAFLTDLPADSALLACGLLLPIGCMVILALIVAMFVTLFAPMKGY